MWLPSVSKALLIMLFAVFAGCESKKQETEGIQSFIEQINSKCPSLLDSETQLDSIELVNANTIIYNYSLIHASAFAVDTQQFFRIMWPGILSTIRVSVEMQKLRDNNMTVHYRYRDAYKQHIYTFKIRPKDYQ